MDSHNWLSNCWLIAINILIHTLSSIQNGLGSEYSNWIKINKKFEKYETYIILMANNASNPTYNVIKKFVKNITFNPPS